MFGNLAALTGSKHKIGKRRAPPPPATVLDFPCCIPENLPRSNQNDHGDLRKTFTNILRTGPTKLHIEALNVSLIADVPLQQMIPKELIPPLSWDHVAEKYEASNGVLAESTQPRNLSNGAPMPSRNVFSESIEEISHDNEDAFRAVRREPPSPDRKPARIVHFRKFWDGLMFMADFWDASLDHYSEEDENDETVYTEDLRSEEEKLADRTWNKPDSKTTYSGRRTDTGHNMPARFREDTVFAFVETLSWAFRCRMEHPKMQPKVNLQGMVLPLPHAGAVYRQPRDKLTAKAGVLEGPMLGVFCRDQTCFRKPEEVVGEGKTEVLDLLREVGLTLMLAQKRARQGKEEEVPGQGKWWAHEPRWGGGPGGEAGLAGDEDPFDDPHASSEGQRKRVKKISKVDAWRMVRPPSSTWEKNIKYLQIGRDKRSQYDDIYLISSVNHHISIVHTRVPLDYIKLVDEATLDPNHSSDNISNPCLSMQRSKWYDLFVAADRVEAMRGIWGILSWLMRDGEKEERGGGSST